MAPNQNEEKPEVDEPSSPIDEVTDIAGVNTSLDGYPAAEPQTAESSKTKQKKAQRRQEREQVRNKHEKANTQQLSALVSVLRALQAALPKTAPVKKQDKKQEDASSQSKAAPADGNDQAAPRESPPIPYPPVKGPRRNWVIQDEAEVEQELDAAEAVLRKGVERSYRSLPSASGPAEGMSLLSGIVSRVPKYQEKHLGQELSLIAKLWALTGGGARGSRADPVAVVDIGAGNGCLAFMAAVVLGGSAALLDMTLPPEELRVEVKVPASWAKRILRVTGDVADLDAERDVVPLLQAHGIRRAVVVAKHLCGVGTDHAMKFVENWRRSQHKSGTSESAKSDTAVQLVGAVFATCCGHKIGHADRGFYAAHHEGDEYLQDLTDGEPGRLDEFLAVCTRCVAWRTTARSVDSRTTQLQVRAAELFEDVLQQPRLNRLRRLFPAAEEVAFVDASSTPQNRCLVAGDASAVKDALALDTAAFLAAAEAARDEVHKSNDGQAFDLRPRGFVSPKYGYDGT
eukprot:TRINITY_DN92008_c0_g1_i1.p1 TRINITY_DN92008_c0_g1~~TRINITY_DN92008_c0_g1_i1.p1  ORF type:complete len:514 (+),score=99.07 TRINITY_DN92008_c0_g1_i1:108-1649(+)